MPDLLLGVVRDSPPHQILCNVVTDRAGRILSVPERPAADQLVGSSRWCGFTAFRAGLLDSVPPESVEHCPHLGDLLSFLLARGARAEALEFRQIHLNLNTADDALLASLIEARRRYRQEAHPRLAAIEDTLAELLLAAAVHG